jgi:hypothetical protein
MERSLDRRVVQGEDTEGVRRAGLDNKPDGEREEDEELEARTD